ncbi:hypothetical protein WG936_05360 [Corynebacterium sp. H127]|uniref:hypothetical protein n=1 Tax=Corynebacterium sp. H127 TaxID=3133418 RepID=UPI0030A6A7DC
MTTAVSMTKDQLQEVINRLTDLYEAGYDSGEVDLEEASSIRDFLEDFLPLPTLADFPEEQRSGARGRYVHLAGTECWAVYVGDADDAPVVVNTATGRVSFGVDPTSITPTREPLRAWGMDGKPLPQGDGLAAETSIAEPLLEANSPLPEIDSEERLRNLPNASLVRHKTSALVAVKHTKNRWKVTGHDGVFSADELWMLFEGKCQLLQKGGK